MAICTEEKIDFLQRDIRNNPQSMSDDHFHKKHELYYLLKGKTRYFVKNEIFTLEPGDMIFVPEGEFHRTVYEAGETVDRVLFIFDNTDSVFSKYIDEMTKEKFITFPKDRSLEVNELIKKCINENESRQKGFEEMKNFLLGELLITISRYRKRDFLPASSVCTVMENIAKYISANYNSNLSLEFLAKQFSISPNHLSKQFKKVTGVGLNEYINISRIVAAEKMLAKGNMSVTAIATECGFNNSNYFAAVFRKLKGITPKKYSLLKTSNQL